MKRFISYILIFIFCFQFFEASFIYVHFKLNQEYIAKVLCINKDLPEMKCNGCCQLKKELSQHENRKKKTETAVVNEKIILLINTFHTSHIVVFPKVERLLYHACLNHPIENTPKPVFHPPKVLS